MPRRPRSATGGIVYHVLNRRAGRLALFGKEADYAAFEKVLLEAVERYPTKLFAYVLMPNHWHLVVLPEQDGELSEFMHWLTGTHTQRWHAHRKTIGTGPLYQGRFKSFPVQTDDYFLTVARYVERNPLRANLVVSACDWTWSSLLRRRRANPADRLLLSEWPVERPDTWTSYVDAPQTDTEVDALRHCVERGTPFGAPNWTIRTAESLGLQSTLRRRGRPRLS